MMAEELRRSAAAGIFFDAVKMFFSSALRIFLLASPSLLFLAGVISLPFLRSHSVDEPYLCHKEGVILRCPDVEEPTSLWENPYSSTTSWKPCAERREKGISDL